MASRFAAIETAPPIEVFALNKAYTDDTFPQKVNLGVGGNKNIKLIVLFLGLHMSIST